PVALEGPLALPLPQVCQTIGRSDVPGPRECALPRRRADRRVGYNAGGALRLADGGQKLGSAPGRLAPSRARAKSPRAWPPRPGAIARPLVPACRGASFAWIAS